MRNIAAISTIPNEIISNSMLLKSFRGPNDWITEAAKNTTIAHINSSEQYRNQNAGTAKRLLGSVNDYLTISAESSDIVNATIKKIYATPPFLKHNWNSDQIQMLSHQIQVTDDDGDLAVLPYGTIAISIPSKLLEDIDFAVISHVYWVYKSNGTYLRFALPHELVSKLDDQDCPTVYIVLDHLFLDEMEKVLGTYLDQFTLITVGSGVERGNLIFYVILS